LYQPQQHQQPSVRVLPPASPSTAAAQQVQQMARRVVDPVVLPPATGSVAQRVVVGGRQYVLSANASGQQILTPVSAAQQLPQQQQQQHQQQQHQQQQRQVQVAFQPGGATQPVNRPPASTSVVQLSPQRVILQGQQGQVLQTHSQRMVAPRFQLQQQQQQQHQPGPR